MAVHAHTVSASMLPSMGIMNREEFVFLNIYDYTMLYLKISHSETDNSNVSSLILFKLTSLT